MALLPGMSFMPGGLDAGSLVNWATQDPNASAILAAQPPPPNMLQRAESGMSGLGALMQGVRAPATPSTQFTGGISGAQQVPAPGGGQSSPTSLSAITGQSPLFTRHGQIPTLGSLIAGGR